MNILITGASGFAGTHLLDLLLRETDHRLTGLYWAKRPERVHDRLTWKKVNLLEKEEVVRAVQGASPDEIYHLASVVGVGRIEGAPQDAFLVNVIGTLNLLEALRRSNLKPKILNVGSSEEYGVVSPKDLPISERILSNPRSFYGMSKYMQEQLAFHYTSVFGFRIIFTRTFHYTGPGQPDGFLFPDLISQVIRGEEAGIGYVKVGNLNILRDFTDIRDIVRAYHLLMQSGRAGELYNVCSGHTRSIKEIAQLIAGNAKQKIGLEFDPSRVRAVDVKEVCGNCKKLKKETDWNPAYRIEETVRDMFSLRRNKLVEVR